MVNPSPLVTTAQLLFQSCFHSSRDFTLLLPDAMLRAGKRAADCDNEDWWYGYCCLKTQRTPKPGKWTSFDFEETLPASKEGATARLQVSRCFDRRAWSVCVRWKPGDGTTQSPPRDGLAMAASSWFPEPHLGFHRDPVREKLAPFLLSISEIVDYVDAQLQRGDAAPQQGLILVAGSTNSGKSEVARGLAWTALGRSKGRPAHLVTCEGPVEKYFWPKDLFDLDSESGPQKLPAIDYTPRQLGSDCDSFATAFTDALRQTPTVFFAGELRSPEEFRQAVEFGGTGHLVIATAHAGSLVEAMAKTFDAVGARRPGARAIYAPKILGIVHLSSMPVTVFGDSSSPLHTTALVPTLYRRTSLGLQGLVADGLAALLPHCPPQNAVGNQGTLGRQYFLKSLSSQLPEGCKPPRDGDTEALQLYEEWPHVRARHFGKDDSSIDSAPLLIDHALRNDLYVG
jgi:hypothetical protein